MRMKGVLALLCMTLTCGAQKEKRETSGLNPKENNKIKICSNLTQVLDNWKFAIITQVKDMLVNDHASVLPEYSRIQPLSAALGDLYRQFNTLKNELGKLTSKLDGVEAFVDHLKEGRFSLPQRIIPPSIGLRSPLRAQMRAPVRGIIRTPKLTRTRRRGPQSS
uniref:uncharacterized protein si:dkey-282h22.5 n=1 Tax=Scatophagus argus TaxID=75038 RepID=UPI001ED84BB0|nr:uncharacterized protein si:dkey-282h22.5 [Scatophagus argus]XP_046272117.1 uncharacterized protein si:dkey-282h22.5 [Scatophagus argus]